jgi:hypothetical protein
MSAVRIFLTPARRSEDLDTFTVNQLRDNLLRWLSPPDSSANHNIAFKARHDGAAQWFFQGSVFSRWKSTDPFLWIHGKRSLFGLHHAMTPDHLLFL